MGRCWLPTLYVHVYMVMYISTMHVYDAITQMHHTCIIFIILAHSHFLADVWTYHHWSCARHRVIQDSVIGISANNPKIVK